MKYLLTLIMCAGLALTSTAQPNMLGKTANEIKEFNKTQAGLGEYVKTDRLDNGDTYLCFSDKEDQYVLLYYSMNADNKCYQYMIMEKLKNMATMVESLNKNYVKYDFNKWLNKENTVKVEIEPKEDRLFVTFIMVQGSN